MANISQTTLAKKVGVTKARINALVKNGTLKPVQVIVPGKKLPQLDEDKALEILSKSLDPSKKRNGKSDTEYHEAKADELKAKVEKINPAARLILQGDGPLKDKIKKIIEGHNLSNKVFVKSPAISLLFAL